MKSDMFSAIVVVFLILFGSVVVFQAVPNEVKGSPAIKMPYSLNYSFYAGFSGQPYYINGKIFLVNNTKVGIYNSNGQQVSQLTLSITPDSVSKLTSTQVIFADNFGEYQIYDISTNILTGVRIVPISNNPILNENGGSPIIGVMPNGKFVYWIINNSACRYVGIYHYLYNYQSPGDMGGYYLVILNESKGIDGIGVYSVLSNSYTNLTFSSGGVPSMNLFYYYDIYDISSAPQLPPGGWGHFIPSITPILPQIFIVDNNTISFIAQWMTTLTIVGVSDILTYDTVYPTFNSIANYTIIKLNFTSKTVSYTNVSSYNILQPATKFAGGYLGPYPFFYTLQYDPTFITFPEPFIIEYNSPYSTHGYGFSTVGNDGFKIDSVIDIYDLSFVQNDNLYLSYCNAQIPHLGPLIAQPTYVANFYYLIYNLTTGKGNIVSYSPFNSYVYFTGFGIPHFTMSNLITLNSLALWQADGILHIMYNSFYKVYDMFSYSILEGSPFYINSYQNGFIISCPTTNAIYMFHFLGQYSVTFNIIGVPENSAWNVSVQPYNNGQFIYYNISYNATVIESTNFTMMLFPITYILNISAPPGYVIYSISGHGKDLYLTDFINLTGYARFKSHIVGMFNISADPVINITLGPIVYKQDFVSNLNLGNSWLSKYHLSSNVKWELRIMHGSNPSAHIFYSDYLPSEYSSLANYTLIQNSTTSNITFYLQNGTYKYIATTISEFIPISLTNLTVSDNNTIYLDFEPNYPHAQLMSVPAQIPLDTAWVFQSTSYALYNTTIVKTIWTITGPVYYYGIGNNFVAYFNVSGEYQLNLTVVNNYGLANSTYVNFSVIVFKEAPMYFQITKKVGYWTNTSATYIVNITYSSKLGPLANVQGVIDGNSYMKMQYVSSINNSGNITYIYYTTFNPSDYPLQNHTVEFSAYTTSGYYNDTRFVVYFGIENYGKPFNLVSFLGGPANFIMILLGIIGTIIAIAEIKISRTSEIIIEAGGQKSVLKAKPIKEPLLKRLKSKSQGKGGKRR